MPVDDEDLLGRDLQFLGDEMADVLRHPGLDLEADHGAAAALLERRLVEAHEILGLFLDLDVRVADDPEAALPLQGVAWEKTPGEQRDHLLEGDEAGSAGLGEIGQADEPLDLRGQADERLEDLALGLHLGLALADELQRDREAEVRDERERVRRIDRERRQHREDVVQEVVLEPGDLRLRQRRGLDEDDALMEEIVLELAPAPLLVGGEVRDGDADPGELLGRGEAVLRERARRRSGPARRGPRRAP